MVHSVDRISVDQRDIANEEVKPTSTLNNRTHIDMHVKMNR